MATRFVKFWTAVGILQFASQGLMLYATPFHGTWLVSLLKMIALILLSFGQRLGVAEDIYNGKVVPLYDAYAPEIETQFGRAREHWGKVNDAFKELATLLLKRIAVGGLSGAVSLPNAAGVEAGSQQSQHGQEGDRIAPALPPETATFSTGRHFFAGKADERAETVSGSNASNMRGAIQATIVEAPKPAYEESRALRERFRRQIKERRGGKLVE